LIEANKEASTNALKALFNIAQGIPVAVLASTDDTELVKIAVRHGAKAFIPVTMRFEIAIEALRFVLAGGTYVPMDCLLVEGWPGAAPRSSGPITAREFAVVRAIQQGKSNKVIAYEFNMCESTVKVHLRNIMKKMKARNRTEVAIKSNELLRCSKCTTQSECWSAGYCAQRSDSYGRQDRSQILSCFDGIVVE
jgi:DNA-binding NarL/FixJ family response regulator